MDQATLMDKIKTGTTLCKAIMRNGYDAYVINARLQKSVLAKGPAELAMDISTELLPSCRSMLTMSWLMLASASIR